MVLKLLVQTVSTERKKFTIQMGIGAFKEGHLVVLINENSASASEIFSVPFKTMTGLLLEIKVLEKV